MAKKRKLTKEQKQIRKQTTARSPKTWIPYAFVVAFVVIIQLVAAIVDSRLTGTEMTFSGFQQLADAGQVQSIDINVTGEVFTFTYIDSNSGAEVVATAWNPRTDASRDYIAGLADVGIEAYTISVFDSISKTLATLPFLLLIIVLVLNMTRSVSKSFDDTATMLAYENLVDFKSIIGLEEVKHELQKIVTYLKQPIEAENAGARPVKGMLLYGPPGVGKTMLAKAVAKESGLKFLTAVGSDFNTMWAGLGGIKLKALFRLARHNSPCVLFIDEIEGLVAKRDFKGGGEVSRDNAKTLNIMLAEMDGLNTSAGVFVIGATNFLDVIDPAVLRGGRLERQVKVSHSGSLLETEAFVRFYMIPKFNPKPKPNKPVGFWIEKKDDVAVEEESVVLTEYQELFIKRMSVLLQGRSPAEIESIINLSIYERLEEGSSAFKISHVDKALSKVVTGSYPRSHEYQEDLHRSAVHEAGHVIMALLQGRDVLKATALRHSDMGGYVLIAPKQHTYTTFEDILDTVKFTLAGLEAERLLLGDASTGFANDMEKACSDIELYIDRLGMGAKMVMRKKPEDTYEQKDDLLKNLTFELRASLKKNKEVLIQLVDRLEEQGTLYQEDLGFIKLVDGVLVVEGKGVAVE